MGADVVLSKVDQHIKSMMLTYPTLFRSRLAALQHLFMTNGNGYEWNADGELVRLFESTRKQEMDYSDLEERKREVDRELAANHTGSLGRLFAGRAAALKREFSERRLIEADIDLYAVEHVMGEDQQSGVEWMKHFDPQWCVMRDAPFGALNPEWAAAAEETMQVASSAIWRHLGMYHYSFDRAKADAKWLRVYDQLEQILDKLDLTTGTKKRVAKQNEMAKKMIDEILAEQGQ
ncbi:hypothetical protein RJ634_003892 [Pseudomonas aeruginosa]|nr:hypothetical protein [Pseudomonas aeruginosa]